MTSQESRELKETLGNDPKRIHELEIIVRGRAGHGKSTMAAVIAGILRAGGAEVKFEDIDFPEGLTDRVFSQAVEVIETGYLDRTRFTVRTQQKARRGSISEVELDDAEQERLKTLATNLRE